MSTSITLTAGVRQNLLSLQSTADLLTTTQNRLATGKKVNTAFDNPNSFFTSQSLSNRASDLGTLLDQIGQAQQTLNAANQGLTSITGLLQSALSTAKQAQQAAGTSTTYNTLTVSGTLPTGETLGTVTSSATTLGAATSLSAADTLSIAVVGGSTYNFTFASTDTYTTIQAAINASGATGGTVSATTDGTGHLKLLSNDATKSFSVNDITGGTKLTTANTPVTASSTDIFQILTGTSGQSAITSGDQLTLAVAGGSTQTLTFGTGSGQIQTLAQLNTALTGISGLTSASTAGGTSISLVVGSSTSQNNLVIGSAGSSAATTILHDLGLTAGTNTATTVSGISSTRQTLQNNFNALLTQIDQLAGDASYNGVNLLNGNNLKVIFNETATSSLTITGVTFNSAGLGLTAVSGTAFQQDTTIQNTINSINTSLSTVRAQSQTFGTNSSTIQTRQDFTKNLINTLQTGSDSLVLADQNQESANLLTLQTRQQLSISALSISNQASQAVLKLFP
jgi:flagellin